MRASENMSNASRLPIDFMGFIFYPKSPRNAYSLLSPSDVTLLPSSIAPVGVFVNEDFDVALDTMARFGLKYAQLHGGESVAYCDAIRQAGYPVLKVFSIDDQTDFAKMKAYRSVTDYFLFDTKSPQHGGTGQKFDWSLLERYTLDQPVFLSGGIGPTDALQVKAIHRRFPWIAGLDLNSKFEIEPGLKDIAELQAFLHALSS